jgi:hypothetical protein
MEFPNLKNRLMLRPKEINLNLNIINQLYRSWVLNFNMEAQTQSNWCWAATSKSVSHFYSKLGNPWTQCKIASDELGQTCCTTPVPGPCNVPWYLDRALSRTRNFVEIKSGTLTWESVKEQIDKGLVVGTRIGWNGGGGHFMVIYGVSKILNIKYFHIDDPIYGKSVLTVNQFSTNYQGSGRWTHTYLTKKYFYFMWIKDLVIREKLLKPILNIRPNLIHLNTNLNLEKEISELELSMPHHTYTLGLNDIGKTINVPKEPSSLRLIEFEKETPLALYDLSTQEEQPEVLQMSTDIQYIQRMEMGMEQLKKATDRMKSAAELKVLKFPALNIEALWLQAENAPDQDRYFLTRSFYNTDEVLDGKSFVELINKRKAEVEKQDDTMGA